MTDGLENRCSIHLSYGGKFLNFKHLRHSVNSHFFPQYTSYYTRYPI